MKITRVEMVVVNAEMRNWIFVKALHFALSTPEFLIQEDMLMDVPYRWDVVKSHLKTQNGHWLPTEVPGLGIEVDEKEAAKYPFKQEIIHPLTIRAEDNSILDW